MSATAFTFWPHALPTLHSCVGGVIVSVGVESSLVFTLQIWCIYLSLHDQLILIYAKWRQPEHFSTAGTTLTASSLLSEAHYNKSSLFLWWLKGVHKALLLLSGPSCSLILCNLSTSPLWWALSLTEAICAVTGLSISPTLTLRFKTHSSCNSTVKHLSFPSPGCSFSQTQNPICRHTSVVVTFWCSAWFNWPERELH